MTFRAFIGEAEHDLALTPAMILELEHKLGSGIAAIYARVFNSNFTFQDLEQTIRLALVGGGLKPGEAAQLVATYVTGRPITEILAPALGVLSVAWFGPDEENPA